MKDYWCTRKKGSVHMSITIAELKNRDKDSYRLIDIRDAIEISHGAVPDAIAVPAEEIETSSEVDKDKLLVIFCARGVVSIDVAEHLKEKRISGGESGRRLCCMAVGCYEQTGGAE